MSHEEAIAIKVYYEALQNANENNIELRYNSKDKVEYYFDTKLTYKVYIHLAFYLHNTYGESMPVIAPVIDIIADFVTKLDEVHSGKKHLTF